jgi:hypothetical protein
MAGFAALWTLLPLLAAAGSAAGSADTAAARQSLCREARAIAALPPCAGPRGCAAYERFAERFGPPRKSEAAAERLGPPGTSRTATPDAALQGAVITFPDRRPVRRTPWPPPAPVPVAPCPAGTGSLQ